MSEQLLQTYEIVLRKYYQQLKRLEKKYGDLFSLSIVNQDELDKILSLLEEILEIETILPLDGDGRSVLKSAVMKECSQS